LPIFQKYRPDAKNRKEKIEKRIEQRGKKKGDRKTTRPPRLNESDGGRVYLNSSIF
jgi:hypothetical protein